MSVHLSPLFSLTCSLLLSSSALTPERVAEIQRQERAAMARIERETGGRRPSELSPEERRTLIRRQAEATQKVLEESGVSAKDYARYVARLTLEERARLERHRLELDELERRRREAEAAANAGRVPVQEGFGEQAPVTLEEGDGVPLDVEEGIPVPVERAPVD